MTRRIEIPMALETSDIRKGAKDAEKALKALEDAVEDTGRGGAKDLDQIEDALKDVQRQSERTERAVDDVGAVGGQGLGKVKAGAQEVTQEIGSNLGEAVSSVRGNLSDLGQVGQDTLGGLAATLSSAGPAGIAGAAALAAGAVGLGLVTAELEAQEERARKLRERMAGLYQEAIESGRDYIDQSQFIAESNDLRFNPDRAEEWKNLQEDAQRLGVDENTIIKANSGELQAQAQVRQQLLDFLASEDAHLDGVYGKNVGLSDEAATMRDRWAAIVEETEKQKTAAEEANASTSKFLKEAISQSEDVQVELDEVGNQLVKLGTGEQIFIDAETGQASRDLSRFKGDFDKKVQQMDGKDVALNVSVVDKTKKDVDRIVNRINGRVASIQIKTKGGRQLIAE